MCNEFIKKHIKCLLSKVRFFEFSILWGAIIFISVKLSDIIYEKTFPICVVITLFIVFGLLYTFLLIFEWAKDNQELNINRIYVLITFLIFGFSLFAGVMIFNNNRPSITFPRLEDGTIGLRAYECEVEFQGIEIEFLDSSNIWRKIPKEVTNNKNNWVKAFSNVGYTPPCNNLCDTSANIILRNSGIKFNTSKEEVAKYFVCASSFKVSTLFKVDSVFNEDRADVQICLNVPHNNNLPAEEELYLGLLLTLWDVTYTKIWIPALEWGIGSFYRDSMRKLRNNDFSRKIEEHKEYNLIGILFDNYTRVFLKNPDTHDVSIILECKRH